MSDANNLFREKSVPEEGRNLQALALLSGPLQAGLLD